MKTLKVADSYRTNPLSKVPGGFEVTILYEDGSSFVYDKVKKPGLYVQSLEVNGKNKNHGPIVQVWVDGAKVWDKENAKGNAWEI